MGYIATVNIHRYAYQIYETFIRLNNIMLFRSKFLLFGKLFLRYCGTVSYQVRFSFGIIKKSRILLANLGIIGYSTKVDILTLSNATEITALSSIRES